MPRCGGCGGVCGCSLDQTASVVISGNGQPTTPWAPSVRRSPAGGNTLIELGDGLFVGTQTPAPVVVADTNSINLSGDGTGGSPISGVLQPAPYAHRTGTGTVPNSTTTDLTLGTSVEMTGMAYVAPAIQIGAGNGGLYVIEASATFPDGAGTFRQIQILVNGVGKAGHVTPGTGLWISATLVIRLAAGDLVKIDGSHISGGTQTVNRALRLTRTGI